MLLALERASGQPGDEFLLQQEEKSQYGDSRQQHQRKDLSVITSVSANGSVNAGGDGNTLVGSHNDQRQQELIPGP